MSLPWNQWASIYLFPPVPLLPKVSSLLLQFQGRGVLVAPFYAQSSWLPNLLLRSPSPIPLPSDHSLSQRTSKGLVFHPDPSAYHLHAWRLWMGLIAAGFYEATADVYLRSYRPSSTKQYQSVWRKFLSFPSKNGFSLLDTSVAIVCNFLTYESTINNLQYRTVSGYRSALRHPLFWSCGLDIKTVASSQFLRGLFNLKPPVKVCYAGLEPECSPFLP